MESYPKRTARATPAAASLPLRPDDPPEVGVFADLARARREGDRSPIARLNAALLGLGWVCMAVEPRQAGKAVRS